MAEDIIRKYLIECGEDYLIRTYYTDNGDFYILKLHGGESFKLNPANIKDYWQQWLNETGCTSDEIADICYINQIESDLKDFFDIARSTVKIANSTSWTVEELEKFFVFTNRPFKFGKKYFGKNNFVVRFSDNKKFEIGFLCNVIDKKITVSEEKILPENKTVAQPSEIKVALKNLSEKHRTK